MSPVAATGQDEEVDAPSEHGFPGTSGLRHTAGSSSALNGAPRLRKLFVPRCTRAPACTPCLPEPPSAPRSPAARPRARRRLIRTSAQVARALRVDAGVPAGVARPAACGSQRRHADGARDTRQPPHDHEPRAHHVRDPRPVARRGAARHAWVAFCAVLLQACVPARATCRHIGCSRLTAFVLAHMCTAGARRRLSARWGPSVGARLC